jgi:hypothetical protein
LPLTPSIRPIPKTTVLRSGAHGSAADLTSARGEPTSHKGRLLLRQGQSQAAEESYGKALSIAREQEAKLWELRAAASLARLWGKQRRRAEATELLAPIYDWFIEGFTTADLKEEKNCSTNSVRSRLALISLVMRVPLDPVGFLAADAPVIASLRRGATCAEAEKINKPRQPGTPHSHRWFK